MSQPEQYYNTINNLISMAGNKAAWIGLCSDIYHLDNPVPDNELMNDHAKYHIVNITWKI